MCVAEPTKLSLWRPTKDDATKITIRSSDGKVQTVDWAAGKATTAWPANMPVVAGAEYQIESAGNSDKSSISFVKVSNPPSDLPGAAQILIKNGCQNQLDLLVDNASKKS
jgi:hypothetical protein